MFLIMFVVFLIIVILIFVCTILKFYSTIYYMQILFKCKLIMCK